MSGERPDKTEPLRALGALMAVDAEGHLRGVVTIDQVTRALQARLEHPQDDLPGDLARIYLQGDQTLTHDEIGVIVRDVEPAGELSNRFFLWRGASGRDRLTIIVPASCRAIAICWFGTGSPRESTSVPVMVDRREARSEKSVLGASSPIPTGTARAAAGFETPGKYVGA